MSFRLESISLELENVVLGVTHDAGPSKGRLERLRGRFPDADAVVFGHSHMPLHEQQDGFQIFNPGSPIDAVVPLTVRWRVDRGERRDRVSPPRIAMICV